MGIQPIIGRRLDYGQTMTITVSWAYEENWPSSRFRWRGNGPLTKLLRSRLVPLAVSTRQCKLRHALGKSPSSRLTPRAPPSILMSIRICTRPWALNDVVTYPTTQEVTIRYQMRAHGAFQVSAGTSTWRSTRYRPVTRAQRVEALSQIKYVALNSCKGWKVQMTVKRATCRWLVHKIRMIKTSMK